MAKANVFSIRNSKGGQKIAMITAYDALFAALFADSADILLVGDSLAMSFGGAGDTLSVTIDQMIYHTKAVCAGAKGTLVVTDMPFCSCSSPKKALKNAARVLRETGAAAVKIEGGEEKAETIRALTDNGIAVMGHIGLLPQFARLGGGFRVQGKDDAGVEKIIRDARAVEEAGAFCAVLEGVKAGAAAAIVKSTSIPVIGIGAGKECDGQVLVWSDMLGFFEAFKPKFVRRYLNGAEMAREAAAAFAADVRSGAFPNESEAY